VTVLLALADVGPGVHLEEALTQAGLPATWDASQADGPRGGVTPTVVVLDADHLGARLGAVADAWRDHPSVPGLVALGTSQLARDLAPSAKVALVSPAARPATLVATIHEASKLRLSSGMRWPIMRTALHMPPIAETQAAWAPTLIAARAVDLDIARAALRWHAQHYATGNAKLDAMREDRILTVPEIETAKGLDGTLTVQSYVKRGPLEPLQSARLLWALASFGAVDLTPEVRDVAAAPRRLVHELREHLRARAARLERSTFYDVLEITPLAEYDEIEAAYTAVGRRFAPVMLAGHDLAELASTVKPMWELVEKARGVLVDFAQRGRYHDWLRGKLRDLRTSWAIDPKDAQTAQEAFARGGKALGDGEVHRAMSDLATACRYHSGHPEYEASLAWARYRVQADSGKDRTAAALAERKPIERMLLGCRPWPRALVALSLLCLAGGDADSARWHLHVALAVDPNVPAAAQLAQRLGMRR